MKSELDEAQIRALEEHEISQGYVFWDRGGGERRANRVGQGGAGTTSEIVWSRWPRRRGPTGMRRGSAVPRVDGSCILPGGDSTPLRHLRRGNAGSKLTVTPSPRSRPTVQSPLRPSGVRPWKHPDPHRPPQQPQAPRSGQGFRQAFQHGQLPPARPGRQGD